MEPNIEYINGLMKAKKLSMRKVAAKAGVSAAALCNVLNRKRGAGKNLIDGIIKAFPEEPINRLFFLPNASTNDYTKEITD